MLNLKRNHTVQTRLETTGPTESSKRFEDCAEPQTRSAGCIKTTVGSDVSIGIEEILSMRVGCWRPPVYVTDDPPR
jgi:hypothetical protein